jgi:hypothetical protein
VGGCGLDKSGERQGPVAAFVNVVLIALMIVAIRPFEISVNFYQTTRHNIPEGSHLRGTKLSIKRGER